MVHRGDASRLIHVAYLALGIAFGVLLAIVYGKLFVSPDETWFVLGVPQKIRVSYPTASVADGNFVPPLIDLEYESGRKKTTVSLDSSALTAKTSRGEVFSLEELAEYNGGIPEGELTFELDGEELVLRMESVSFDNRVTDAIEIRVPRSASLSHVWLEDLNRTRSPVLSESSHNASEASRLSIDWNAVR